MNLHFSFIRYGISTIVLFSLFSCSFQASTNKTQNDDQPYCSFTTQSDIYFSIVDQHFGCMQQDNMIFQSLSSFCIENKFIFPMGNLVQVPNIFFAFNLVEDGYQIWRYDSSKNILYLEFSSQIGRIHFYQVSTDGQWILLNGRQKKDDRVDDHYIDPILLQKINHNWEPSRMPHLVFPDSYFFEVIFVRGKVGETKICQVVTFLSPQKAKDKLEQTFHLYFNNIGDISKCSICPFHTDPLITKKFIFDSSYSKLLFVYGKKRNNSKIFFIDIPNESSTVLEEIKKETPIEIGFYDGSPYYITDKTAHIWNENLKKSTLVQEELFRSFQKVSVKETYNFDEDIVMGPKIIFQKKP